MFTGNTHWAAHLTAYALIAFAFGRGWPQWPAPAVFILVAMIGAVHETTEIITHGHGFETNDVILNALGAIAGIAIQRTISRRA